MADPLEARASAPGDADFTVGRILIGEAVELGHAWCQWLADAHGIRILFLKGPALAEYSLRSPRPSTDIDVLVDPKKWDEFVAVATNAGWVEREYTAATQLLSTHSRNFVRENWPCDLDLHRHYPGFLAPPENVFETLWSRRSEIELGKVWCQVPDRNAAILILALHSLRGCLHNPGTRWNFVS